VLISDSEAWQSKTRDLLSKFDTLFPFKTSRAPTSSQKAANTFNFFRFQVFFLTSYPSHFFVRTNRFHDPTGDSVFANSHSIGAFDSWSNKRTTSGSNTPDIFPLTTSKDDPSAIEVHTSNGDLLLSSLVTPRSAHGKRIRYAVWEYETLIDSSEISPADWLQIAGDIERNYHAYDGFIVLHGTDTMSYSASALSFLLEDLG